MTPLHTPPHLWAPYPDETAPHGPPIRGEMCPEMKRFLRGASYAGGYRYKTKTAPVDDVSYVVDAHRGR